MFFALPVPVYLKMQFSSCWNEEYATLGSGRPMSWYICRVA